MGSTTLPSNWAFVFLSSILRCIKKRAVRKNVRKKSSARRSGNRQTEQGRPYPHVRKSRLLSASPLFGVSASRARFSFKIFTPGLLPRPSRGLSVALATSPRTCSSKRRALTSEIKLGGLARLAVRANYQQPRRCSQNHAHGPTRLQSASEEPASDDIHARVKGGLNSNSRLVPLDLNFAVPKRLENGI